MVWWSFWTVWTPMLILYCPVCVPLDVGIFYVFYALFRLPNVGQGYNYITLFVNCNSLSGNLAQ